MRRIFFVIFILITLLSLGYIVMRVLDTGLAPENTNEPTPTDFSELDRNRPVGTIASRTGNYLSAQPFMEYSETVRIADQYYVLTNNDARFEWSYFDGVGNLEVMLFGEDTKNARLEAEAYIRGVFPYSDAELCTLDVLVITNEYENAVWAEYRNLGFSFCAGSVTI